MFQASFQHRERSDTGGTHNHGNLQHISRCSGKGGPPEGLWTPGGTVWVQMDGGDHNICFYADYGQIVGCNLIWVHTALTAMVRMFERVGLHSNMRKPSQFCACRGTFGASRELMRTSGELQDRDPIFGRGR